MALLSGRSRGVPHHRHLTRRGARRIMPALRKDALVGALHYYDGQVDDARHTMFLSRTAAAYGAHVASRTRVIDLLREGDRVVGARVKDLESGARVRHPRPPGRQRHRRVDRRDAVVRRRARSVPRPRQQGHPPRRAARPDPRRVRADPAHREVGAVRHPVGPALDHRHHRHRLVAVQGPPGRQRAATSTTCSTTSTRCSVEPLDATRTSRASTPACARCWRARTRPPASSRASTRSRTPVKGLVVIAGGKYTTYRVMAKDASTPRCSGMATLLDRRVPPCVTEDIPLLGADGYDALWNQRQRWPPQQRPAASAGSSTC